MNETLYWLWLQEQAGAGAKTAKLLEAFGDIRAVYEATHYESLVTAAVAKRLLNKDLDTVQKRLAYCTKKGYRVLTPAHEAYPAAFRSMPDFPCAVYVDGDFDFNHAAMIALVGARKASYYGLNVATRLAYSLTVGGMTVVSGGALGTDTAVHKGALLAGGNTVLVLGCGLEGGYLKENASLLAAVKSHGAVLSEFPPEVKANRFTFPMRNRLIAALSLGTVVVQAGAKSGSLITADFAKQYGRDVYGVPGGIYNQEFQGVNALIRDGAGIVTGVADILENYAARFPNTIHLNDALAYDIVDKELVYEELPATGIEAVDEPIALNFEQKKRVSGLSPKTRLVYDSLETGAKHLNEISVLTSLSQPEVLSHLTTLELMDAVVAEEGRKYRQV